MLLCVAQYLGTRLGFWLANKVVRWTPSNIINKLTLVSCSCRFWHSDCKDGSVSLSCEGCCSDTCCWLCHGAAVSAQPSVIAAAGKGTDFCSCSTLKVCLLDRSRAAALPPSRVDCRGGGRQG